MVFGLAAFALIPTQAEAQPILQQRCAADNLDSAMAEQRLEWARKCGLLKNVGSPTYGYDTGMPSYNGAGNLIEYQEADPARNPYGQGTFSGPSGDFEVNSSYVNNLYLSGGTNQSVDGWGYKKWTRVDGRKRPRPLYPTFGTTPNLADPNNTQLWAHPTMADCNLYSDPSGSVASLSNIFYVNGYCEASCYTPDQEVLFEGGSMPILDAVNARREDLMTLSADSTLDALQLQKNRTYSYTVETRDTQHNIFVIRTASGGELRVTDEHPVINGNGRLVQAQTLKVGQELMRANGSPDGIVDIQKTTHFGKVYNLRPVSRDLVSNVLIAQGFLVGSSNFQNDDVGYVNRVLLFRTVPHETIP
jgi:hypothetical protein